MIAVALRCSLREGWARQDSNLGPRDYESPALTAELQARKIAASISQNRRSAKGIGYEQRRRDFTAQATLRRFPEGENRACLDLSVLRGDAGIPLRDSGGYRPPFRNR